MITIFQVCTVIDLTDTIGELTCPDDCTNPSQGICNGFDGTCICMPGFGGYSCSVPNGHVNNLQYSSTKAVEGWTMNVDNGKCKVFEMVTT